MDTHDQARKVAEMALKISQELADKGKVVEGGWMAMKIMFMPTNAPSEQVDDMRKAFYFGAEHVFSSLMALMDPGEEPTNKDLERVTKIHAELVKFKSELHRQ